MEAILVLMLFTSVSASTLQSGQSASLTVTVTTEFTLLSNYTNSCLTGFTSTPKIYIDYRLIINSTVTGDWIRNATNAVTVPVKSAGSTYLIYHNLQI